MYCFITPTNTIVFHTQGLISLVTFNNTRKMYPINSLLTIYCHLQRVCISLIYQMQRQKFGVILKRYWLLCLLFYVQRNKLILLNLTSAWYFYSSNNQHLIVLCLCPPTLLLDIAKQMLSWIKFLTLSVHAIFISVRPAYVDSVGSAPNARNKRTISKWSISTASCIGLVQTHTHIGKKG